MNIKITSDRSAAVDQNYFWKRIDKDTPKGVKLQLINRALGVASYGMYTGGVYWTHWAPLPRFEEHS